MSSRKRRWQPNSYYHVIMRGNNRQNIFSSADDMRHFMRAIGHAHIDYDFSMIAFCIMTNHYHFLIRSKEDLAKIMARINRKYSDYYSKRYRHVGRIYQRRYFAKAIEDPTGLLAVSRYIHRNPIETETPMVKQLESYSFSSFPYYYFPHRDKPPYLDIDTITNYLSPPSEKTIAAYCEYCKEHLPLE